MLQTLRELVRYRALLRYLVVLDLRLRYRGSFLGFLWSLLNPLLLMLVMWAVFSRVARIEESNYALFLLSGLMGWTFFQQSVTQSLTAITGNRGLIQKVYLPKVVFPISVVTSNLVNGLFFLMAYLLIAAFTEHGIPWTAIFVLPALGMVYALAAGVATLMCALTVFFRDLTHLTSVIMRALFYITPVIYRPGLLGPNAEELLRLNPVYYPVVTIREVLYYGRMPGPELWGTGFAIALVAFALGLLVFSSTENKFVYYA